MGKTSSAVKNRYNAKAYDPISLRVKKGEKERVAAYAAAQGKSLNGYIVDLIERDMQKSGKLHSK
jgi:predicted HicB family RNase H-like nuclease